VVHLEISHEEFWKLTLQEYWLYLLKFNKKIEIIEQDQEDKLWMLGVLQAHIANCLAAKADKKPWTYRDFIRLKGDEDVVKEKLTLKKAKQTLGSKFNLN
jgi:hypothetical protein